MLDCLAVGAGGFVGAVLRWLVGLIPVEMKIENGGKAVAAAYIAASLICGIAAVFFGQKIIK